MKRVCEMIGLRGSERERYIELHDNIWPEISALIRDCNIRNYTIFERAGMLYAYYEYIGEDHAADMRKMAENEVNKEWWAACGPCQQPLTDRKPGEWWAGTEEIWHQD
ncbi:MAG: L-rhamnose mutarotase [Oscillospiraceae bacterium]|nr:L-rhamnose mutarotase [Oscillospiraceae bacterium]